MMDVLQAGCRREVGEGHVAVVHRGPGAALAAALARPRPRPGAR